MRKQFTKAILLSCATVLSVNGFAQWTNTVNDNFDKSCRQKTDWILDAVKNPNWYRFGILNRGAWGGTALEDQYINIGPGDLGTITGGAIIAPVDNRFYGVTTTMNSDRMFVGLRARRLDNVCTNTYTTDNRADGVIAWGNDSSGAFADRLIFEYHDWTYPAGGPNFQREIATMMPSGNVGIGTPAPTHQLHVMRGVRFQGLPPVVFNPSIHDVIVEDANGVLYHTNINPGGVTNLCATTDFVTKTDPSGNLTCSQIYDDGTSVGIGTTTGTVGGSFSYTLGGGYGTLLGTISPTPMSGTVLLDVNGVSRSLAYLAYSDENLKANIRKVDHALDIITKLDAKTYDWNDKAKATLHADNGRHIGFIAQELSKVVPEIVVKDEHNNYAVNYTELIPILAEGIKEQQELIEQLRAEVTALKSGTNINDAKGSTGLKIFPNPSNGAVTIEFGNMGDKDMVLITDLNGKMIKQVTAAQFSNHSYKMEKGTFAPGIYLVTLASDNATQQTQRLVITE